MFLPSRGSHPWLARELSPGHGERPVRSYELCLPETCTSGHTIKWPWFLPLVVYRLNTDIVGQTSKSLDAEAEGSDSQECGQHVYFGVQLGG
jgi:hypothetical protein